MKPCVCEREHWGGWQPPSVFGVSRYFLLLSGGLTNSTLYWPLSCPLVPLSLTLLERLSPVHLEDQSVSSPSLSLTLQLTLLAPLPLEQFHGSMSLLKHDSWGKNKNKQHSSFRPLDCNPESVLSKPQIESNRTGPDSLPYPGCLISDNATEVGIRALGIPSAGLTC